MQGYMNNRGLTAMESLAQGPCKRWKTFVSEHCLGPGSFWVNRLYQLLSLSYCSLLLLLAYLIASLLSLCCVFSYTDIALESVQSTLLYKLWASVGLVMKSYYMKGRKKPAFPGSPKCFLTCSKHSELFSYCVCSCAPRPKSNTDITCNTVCSPQMAPQVCILWEALVKILPSTIKAVVCLLVKVKGEPRVVIHSMHTLEISSKSQGSCFTKIWIWFYSDFWIYSVMGSVVHVLIVLQCILQLSDNCQLRK